MKKRNRPFTKQPFKISVRALFGILFFLLMAGTILLNCLLNSVFLERYYVNNRKKALISVYNGLQNASVHDILELDSFERALHKALRGTNTSLLVVDSGTRTLKVWSADKSVMEERLYANIFGVTPVLDSVGSEEDDDSKEQSEKELNRDQNSETGLTKGAADNADAGAAETKDAEANAEEAGNEEAGNGKTDSDGTNSGGINSDERNTDGTNADETNSKGGEAKDQYVITQILDEEQSYTIHIVLDRNAGTRSMEMWGPLGENSFFLLRSPLEDIRSRADVANRFFAYTGLILAAAGALLAFWLSRTITEPVRQLTAISERMKDLDFGVKYEGGSRTELDLLGANMNELSQKLEETICALRTANNDLQRDIDRRDRQEEMRQDFLSSVTHELKTPIALIRGYAEGLQDGIADDPESRAFYLDTIVEESDKMNTIVQKVLLLNQLEFGGGSVAMERFDLAGMIRNYLESAALLARQEGVSLLYEQNDPVYAWGDPFLIQEVLQNYYSNAIHHVQPAGVKKERVIEIRCEGRGETVRVTVFNTGRPIPEASLPHIWEKFYKVDKARTRAYGGSGVGLSIVKAVMELHHRGYGVENYENGVAFWFELDGNNPG